ncbi:MAG TPA: c-type cytochrome [Bryobacteraceae bacterium]|nr:c-type cytochrome [Bryobacteraceae bacterium]
MMQGRPSLWLLLPAVAFAQEPLARGTDVFNKSCATGYCHQVNGSGGGAAPRLAARGFEEDYILRVIQNGIPGTPMPAFSTSLSRADLMAVVAYVDSLNGIKPAMNASDAGPPPRKLSGKAQEGRKLFSDQVLGFARCSTCHQVDGLGLPIASPMQKIPENVAALKQLETPGVSTATLDQDGAGTFPALVLTQSQETKVYDLTLAPPVLRTVPKAAIKIVAGSSWRHASVLTAYSDAELEFILAFLREALPHGSANN